MIKKVCTIPYIHDSIILKIESDTKKGKVLSIDTTVELDTEIVHTIILSYFTPEDINKLAQCLDTVRTDK